MGRILMSDALESLPGAFDLRSEAERRMAASEIVRRVNVRESTPLDDEIIDRIARESFLASDVREASDPDA
jgi:hypothetical protein